MLDIVDEDLMRTDNYFNIGAICLKNEMIKETIKVSIFNIKHKLLSNLHEMCKASLE